MSVLLDWIVPAASTVTASAALATATYARRVVRNVEENRERSVTNQELLIGDPDMLDRPVLDRLRDLEDEIET